MMSVTIAGAIGALLLTIIGYFKWQAFRANRQAVEFAEKNAKLAEKNAQLQTKNAVAQTQIKNFKVKQANEEMVNVVKHDDVIDRLHADGDLRD